MAERDRGGTPYEVTLELHRDGRPFGVVGQRCGYLLAALAERLAAARADDSPEALQWPDPDDRFPPSHPVVPRTAGRAHCRCAGAAGPPSPDPELFALRYRDRVDVTSTGELRCSVRTSSVWLPGPDAQPDAFPAARASAQGRWRVARRAVIEAWGAGGRGVRAVLTSAELSRFLTTLLAETERQAGPCPDLAPPPAAVRRPHRQTDRARAASTHTERRVNTKPGEPDGMS
ncbi:hypothetical protein [Thermomonospora umbrina]|uniref:hypothetical protein n=1 Tax=Thermomonospora umbrina TaxID=111806 RepID=UPI001FE69A68|nr:hypothetical protein [Thermomonospora umbrina]